MKRVVIVGGGISGLSAAYYLARAGFSSTLIEQRPRLGGVIRTERLHGCTLEAGPDSFLSAKPWALELIRDLGLTHEVVGSNDHLRVTYVRKNGRLVPLPDGLMLMVPTRILPMIGTRLLSWRTKTRMGREYFRRPTGRPSPDRSVGDFIRDHYGEEAVDYLAEPLLAGVYGGDPELLSVSSVLGRFVEMEEKYGSLTRGVLAERRRARRQEKGAPLFQSLQGGLGRLVDAVTLRLQGFTKVLQAKAVALEKLASGFRVHLEEGSVDADLVVLACAAHDAGALVQDLDPALVELLGSVPYNSSITVSLGYDKNHFRHRLNGFGFLVPKRERRRVVACTWVGTKFSFRVAEDRVVLRCFLGGDSLPLSDAELVAEVKAELRDIMGVTEEPMFHYTARWPYSMAQYVVGHQQRIDTIERRLTNIPGLFLAGNAYSGIGIPDCVRTGKLAAERILQSASEG